MNNETKMELAKEFGDIVESQGIRSVEPKNAGPSTQDFVRILGAMFDGQLILEPLLERHRSHQPK